MIQESGIQQKSGRVETCQEPPAMENSADCVTLLSNSPDRELETECNLITLILYNSPNYP